MKSSFFAYISRMRYIPRWALMRNSFSENVQEHSHMVAVLAHALAVDKHGRAQFDSLDHLFTPIKKARARIRALGLGF